MANTIYVNSAWKDQAAFDADTAKPAAVWDSTAFATIKAAIEAASDGDTIIIAAGDYTVEGEIQINKALTVKATEGAEVIVDHVVLGNSFNDPNVSAVTISGLTIKPTAHNSGDWNYTGVWQNNTNISTITIKNCVIDFSNTPDDVKSIGIKLSRGNSGDAVETLKITGNTIVGTDNTQSYITVGDKGSISSVTVEGNECSGGSSSSAVTLDFGYKTTGEVSVLVTDNKVADVTDGHGINFGNVKNSDIDITVTGNTVENVTGVNRAAINMHDTSTEAGKVTVSDNVISDSIIGVNMSAVQGVVISDNTLTDCDESIIYTDGSVISGNTVDGEELTFPAYSGSDIFVNDKVTGEDGDKVIIDGIAYVVGENVFANLADAAAAATAGSQIIVSGDGVIDAGGYFDKGGTVTITGKAALDWEATTYVGRSSSGNDAADTELRISNAEISWTPDSDGHGNGIHVSGAKKDAADRKDGILTIENSKVELGYMINRGTVNIIGAGVGNSDTPVYGYNGEANLSLETWGMAGRPETETESGEKATATMNLSEGAFLKLTGSDEGMGIGQADTYLEGYGVLNIEDSKFVATQPVSLSSNGTINVSGKSDVNANVTGSGWIYMDGVTLDADTKLYGANVRFASGVNTIDGAIIDNGKFQIGQGQYNNTDSRIDMANGITVNVKNNAYIGAEDNDYYGWIGTGYFDTDADKLANMTDARYTLNIDKSTASFGYMHVSNDGIMNVTGVADSKEWYNNSDYSFYTGRFIVNGKAVFDAADTLVSSTIVSSDNGTENGGHLVITNGTYYEAESHDGADDSRVNLDIRKTGVVDVDGGSTLYVGGKVSVAEKAVVNVNGANFEVTGTVTNAGTIKVSGESTLDIAILSGNAIQAADGATLTDSKVVGTVQMLGDLNFAGDNEIKTIDADNGGTLTVEDGKTLALTNFSFGNEDTADAEYVITGGEITASYGFFQHGTYTLESDFETGYMYYSSGSDITVTGSFHSQGKGDGLDYVRGNLTIADGGESIHDKALWVGQPADWGEMTASMTVDAGGYVQASTLKVYAGSSASIAGAVKANTLENTGVITITAVTGLIEAGSLSGDGTITIDATDFTGTKKVIDLNGTESLADKVTVNGEGITAVYGADGDVTITDASAETVYFDYNWADKVAGTEVAAGKVIGVNAFAEFTDNGTNDKDWSNLLVLPEDTKEIVLTAGNGDAASYGMLRPTQSITVKTEGEGYAVIDRFVNMGCDLTFAKDSKVKVIGNVGLSGANNQGGTVTINGEVYMAIAHTNGNKALYLWGMNDTPGQLVINAGGILKADCANVENHGTITVYGTMELGKDGDAPKLAGVGANNGGWHGHLIVDGKDGEGIVSVAHNQLNFGGGNTSVDWQEPAGDCSVDIINGGKITTAAVSFRNGAKNTLTINNGTLEFTNDQAYAGLTPRYFDNQGIINVTNGTLDMSDRSFDNTGSLTVAGESTVKITDLVSSESEMIFNSADLTDSEIAGKQAYINVKGENTYDGSMNVNWIKVGYTENDTVQTGSLSFSQDSAIKAGVLQVANGSSLTYGSENETFTNGFNVGELYVDKGASLTIQNVGEKSAIPVLFAQGDVVVNNADINGNDLVLGNSDGTASMLIKDSDTVFGGASNAVVILGDAAGGTLTLENSNVTIKQVGPGSSWKDTTLDVLTIGYKDAAATININSGSTFTVNNGIAINEQSKINVNGGTISATGDIQNNGTITIDSTSLLKAADITMGDSATITLNVAEDFSGYHKFIDLNADYANEPLDVNFGVDVGALGLTVIHSDDGDVALAKVDSANLFVDTNWEDNQEKVDAVFGKDTAFLGTNAFSSMTGALEKAEENMVNLEERKVTIEVMATTDAMGEAYDISNAGTYVITGGSGENIGEFYATANDIDIVIDNANIAIEKISAGEKSKENLWGNPNLAPLSGSDITITNSVVYGVPNNDQYAPAYMTTVGNSVVTIENSVVGCAAEGVTNSQAMMTFSSGGEVNMTSSEFYSGWHFSITDRGVATLDGTTLYAGTLNVGYAPVAEYQEGRSDVTLQRRNDSDFAFASSGDYREGEVGAVAEVILTNGSLISSDYYWGNGNASKGIRIGGDGNIDGYPDTQAGKLTVKDNSKIVLKHKAEIGSVAPNNITLAANGELAVSDGGYVETIGVVTNAGTITLDGSEETVTFKANEVINNGTFTVSGASLDITALEVAEFATFSIGTVYAEGEKDIASTNTVNIDNFTGNITLTDDAVIAEGSKIETTDGTITVADDATLYWDTVSGAAITVTDELAFEGFDFSKETVVYSGAVTWTSTEQDLIINGKNVVWDTAAAAAVTTVKTGTVIDAEGNIYTITVGDNFITAERVKDESGEDATVEALDLTLGAVTRGTENDYYMITFGATAVGGSREYEWSLVVDGEELDPDKYNYSDGIFTFDSRVYAADGEVAISVTVKDGYGTTVTEKIEPITTWDKDDPDGKVTYSPSNWTNGDVEISITPEDQGGSGISSVLWVIGEDGDPNQESDFLTGDDKGVYSFDVSENTKGYFLVHDWAGNFNKITFDVQHIDKSGIAIGVTGYESGVWTNKDVTFTVTATETASTTSVYADVDGTKTKVENGSFTVSDEGESTVKFIANNQAGTESESSEYVVKIDKVLPKLTDFSYKLQNGDIVVSYESSDDRSGVSKVKFYVDGKEAGESEDATGTFSFKPVNESTAFYLAVIDAAGNVYESEAETVKVSGGSSADAGESQIVQDLHIGDHFTDEELKEMEENYSILPEGESTVSVQKGFSAQAKGFGKENGTGSNNISLGKGSSLEVYENIDNLGDVSIGKYGSLTVLSQKEGAGETLSGTDDSQSVGVGKGAGLHVCGNLDLGDGHDALSSGKYGKIEICGDLIGGAGNDSVGVGKGSDFIADSVDLGVGDDALSTGKYSAIKIAEAFNGGDGSDSVGLGKGSSFAAASVDLGAGDDALSTGKYSAINITGAFNGGDGSDSIGLGKGSSFAAASVDFGAGNDALSTGKYGAIDIDGAFNGGDGSDSIGLGKGSSFAAASVDFGDGNDTFSFGKYASARIGGDLDFGAGYDTLSFGKGNTLEIAGALTGVEEINCAYGSIYSGEDFDFDNVAGNWDLLSLFHNAGEVNAGADIAGGVYRNEMDIYTAADNLTLDFSGIDNVDVDVWSDGAWRDAALTNGQLQISAGTSFSVSIDDDNAGKTKSEYEFKALA